VQECGAGKTGEQRVGKSYAWWLSIKKAILAWVTKRVCVKQTSNQSIRADGSRWRRQTESRALAFVLLSTAEAVRGKRSPLLLAGSSATLQRHVAAISSSIISAHARSPTAPASEQALRVIDDHMGDYSYFLDATKCLHMENVGSGLVSKPCLQNG